MSDERSSKWAFIVYPDSAPCDWKDLLKLTFIRCAVSPLHAPDHDKNALEQERKTHWHVMLDFDSLKSFSQVSQIIYHLNGTIPFIVHNPSGYFQYLIHYNNPEKEQFKNGFDDIELFNGFNADKYMAFSDKQLDAIYEDVCNFIDDNNITEYSTLIDCLLNPEFDMKKYFRIVRKNTIYFNTYLCSRRNRIKKQEVHDINSRLLKLQKEVERLKK